MCELLDRIEQQGIEKGMLKGIKQGIEKGIEEGIKKERFSSIERMLKNGKSPEQISLFCAYSLDDVFIIQKAIQII